MMLKIASPLLLLAFVALSCTAAPSLGPNLKDIARAIEKRPRDGFRGVGSLSHTNQVLNTHLVNNKDLSTKACEELTIAAVQDSLRVIYGASHPELLDIYNKEDDNRQQRFESFAQMEAKWAQDAKEIGDRKDLSAINRDGLCHEAVMWYTHHLTAETKRELASTGFELPLLPKREHTSSPVDVDDTAATKVHSTYMAAITCQKCHVGGIDNLGVPEVKPKTQKELSRRCYTNYKDLFGITCKPCDGIAGVYWGDDDDKYFTPDPCSVVGTPDDIPESERVPAVFPPQFSVDVVAGSDRWGRTTNPAGHVKTPFPPLIDSMYGQISGKWFVDITEDSDLWLLRHDTKYRHVAFNGTHMPLLSFDVSEIHSQTKAQQAVNCTGPMVSLVNGLPSQIPGGCTCVADPVGVPDVHHSRTDGLDEMQYFGRINITLSEYDGSSVVVDHWANWFFHVFMEVDKSVPHYGKAPKRLASAYAGTATYENWDLKDPKIKDPTVWYRGIPVHPERVGPDHGKFCMNPQKLDMCNNISTTTFPPAPAAVSEKAPRTPWRMLHKSFLPSFDKVQDELTKAVKN